MQLMAPQILESSAGANGGARSLSYNPAENAVLITSDTDGYELHIIPKDPTGRDTSGVPLLFTVFRCESCAAPPLVRRPAQING